MRADPQRHGGLLNGFGIRRGLEQSLQRGDDDRGLTQRLLRAGAEHPDNAKTRTRRLGVFFHLLRKAYGRHAAVASQGTEVAIHALKIGRPGCDRKREADGRLTRKRGSRQRRPHTRQRGCGQACGLTRQSLRQQT